MMKLLIPHKPLLLAAVLLVGLLACAPREPAARWYKGNLHTHTYWSDGDDFPEPVVDWYKSHGYDFLALSDHNILQAGEKWLDTANLKGGAVSLEKYRARFGDDWVEMRTVGDTAFVRLKRLDEFRPLFEEEGQFLLIKAEEITDGFEGRPVHVNATNLVELILPQGGGSVVEVMRNNIRAVLDQRERTGQPMFPHLNHPNFGWGVTAEDLLAVPEERFFEIYNGHPGVRNYGDDHHAGAERVWDILLTRRLAEQGSGLIYGLAVDDAHNYHADTPSSSNPGRGWIMVRSAELTPAAIVEALEAGEFYATTGVLLRDIQLTGNRLSLVIEAEEGVSYTTSFIGTRRDYDPSSEAIVGAAGEPLPVTRRYSDDIGETLAVVEGPQPTYTFAGDELYVRARVVSTRPKANPFLAGDMETAWVQPVVLRSPGR